MPDMLETGEIFAGRYRVERELGRGGLGVVYACEHLYTGQKVALKLLLAEPQRGLELAAVVREKFRLEQRVWSQAPSEHIVRVLDAGNVGAGNADAGEQAPGTLYIVMELLNGETLQQHVERAGVLPPAEVVRVLQQIALGLDEAHACRDASGKPAPIVHRDLTPRNVFLIRRADGSLQAKLLDFGIAKQLVAGAPVTEALLGTRVYIAPEQFKGLPLSAQTDIWSFGLTAYYALTGRDYGRDPGVRAQLPAAFERWFSRCTAEEPARRFASAGEAAAELARAVASVEAEVWRSIGALGAGFVGNANAGAAVLLAGGAASLAGAPLAALPLAIQDTAELPASASGGRAVNPVVAATAVESRGASPGVTARIEPRALPVTDRTAAPAASEGSLHFRWLPLALAAVALASAVYFIRAERGVEPVPGAAAGSVAPASVPGPGTGNAAPAAAPGAHIDEAPVSESSTDPRAAEAVDARRSPTGPAPSETAAAEPGPAEPGPPPSTLPRPAPQEIAHKDSPPSAGSSGGSGGASSSESRRPLAEVKAPVAQDRPRPASSTGALPPRTGAAKALLETLGKPATPAR